MAGTNWLGEIRIQIYNPYDTCVNLFPGCFFFFVTYNFIQTSKRLSSPDVSVNAK